jgi:hypothetical protein
VARITSMLTKKLLQCHACRLTWFPQGRAAACPACGGSKVGGTLELFHAGLALIALGLIGWFLRQGPLSEHAAAPALTVVQTKQLTPSAAHGCQVYVSSKKIKSNKVHVKRRRKKAKTRSKYVQR